MGIKYFCDRIRFVALFGVVAAVGVVSASPDPDLFDGRVSKQSESEVSEGETASEGGVENATTSESESDGDAPADDVKAANDEGRSGGGRDFGAVATVGTATEDQIVDVNRSKSSAEALAEREVSDSEEVDPENHDRQEVVKPQSSSPPVRTVTSGDYGDSLPSGL